MTRSNPIQATENNPSDVQFQRKFWGVVAISVLALLAYAYALSNLLKLEPTTAVYIKMAVYIAAMGLAVTSLILSFRRQVDLALTLIFYFLLIVQIVNPATTQGRTLNATFTMLVVGTLMIGWLLPRAAWRRNAAFLAGAFILAWVFEWIDPPWRVVTVSTGAVGPAVAVIFSVVLIILVVRETWGRSMRNKLIVAFIGLTLFATAALGIPIITESTRFLETNLEQELTTLVVNRATSLGNLLGEQVNVLTTLSLNEVLLQEVEASNQNYLGGASAIQAELDAKDAQWRAADAANNNNDPLVRENLTNRMALELAQFQQVFPNHIEVFITDVHGGLAGTTNRTSDYYQADEAWWQAAYNDGQGAVYISDPEFDESANDVGVQIALPLRNRANGEIIGILRTTYVMSGLGSILQEDIGETGSLDLFVPGETVAHYHEGKLEEAVPGLFEQLTKVRDQGMVELVYEDALSVVTQAPIQTLEGNPAIEKLNWIVAFHQHRDEAFNQINGQTQGVLYTSLVILPFAVLAAFGLSIFLLRPILSLTRTAQDVASGDLNSRANITTTDEIGILASTFNSMTSQLQETLQGLEERVAARPRDLAIVAEVGTATATILESKRLLQEVVDLTKERFNLYHSHIYLLDEKGENLVLTAGAGEPGRVMVAEGRTIPLDREQSLVARAARERKGVTVNDVTQEPDHLPNPLLPDTRSELAVPMIVGNQVIGVFDIQSEQVGRFTESDVNIQTTLAAQLAVSIQNVRSFEQSKKQAELQSLVNVIGGRIQRAATIEETLQTAIRELGTAIGASRVKAKIQPASKAVSTEPTTAD